MNHVGIQFSRLDQVFDFGDSDPGRCCHHGIEIARGFAIDEVTPLVALPSLDESEVGFQRALHDVSAALELARFFAFGDDGSNAGGRIERGNASAPRANSLGKRSLRNQVEMHRAVQHHLFQQFIFANVSSDMVPDLAIGEQQSHTEAVDANVIADGGEVLNALAGKRADQVLRHPAQTKSTHHDGGAVKHVLDRLFGARYNFVHCRRIL